MTFSSRDQTENIQPSLSGANIEGQEPQSKLSASSDNTQTFTQTSQKPSKAMLSEENKGSTTLTTLKVSEKTRQHAMIARVALLQLEKAGLVKRYKVLSKDTTTLKEIRIVFNPSLWTTDLVLSDETDNTDNTKKE